MEIEKKEEKTEKEAKELEKLGASLSAIFSRFTVKANFLELTFKNLNFAHTLSKLKGAKNFQKLFTIINKLETKIFSQINRLLSELDKEIPLKEQMPLLEQVKDNIYILRDVNRLMVDSLPFFIDKVDGSIQELDKKIVVKNFDITLKKVREDYKSDATQEELENSNQNALIFLEKMHYAVLLSLMKAKCSTSKSDFVSKLLQTLTTKGHTITLAVNYTSAQKSFAIYMCSSNALAKPGKKDAQDKIKSITRGEGSSSLFLMPVWPEPNQSIKDVFGIYFTDKNAIERAINNLIMGSFSFDEQGGIFYTSMSLEIIHELIHALHNSRGTNRQNIYRIKEFMLVWKDSEEYWTIKGGKISENSMCDLADGHRRYTHFGLSISSILDPKPGGEIEQPLCKLFGKG
jgi:hypothetical protein